MTQTTTTQATRAQATQASQTPSLAYQLLLLRALTPRKHGGNGARSIAEAEYLISQGAVRM